MRTESLLLVIDVQEKLLSAMHQKDRLQHRVIQLIQGFTQLNKTILITEQLPEKLGPALPELIQAAPHAIRRSKSTFNVLADPECADTITHLAPSEIMVCGIESHICVTQTVVALREKGFTVSFAVDAMSSRKSEDIETAKIRMIQAGAHIATVEMALFTELKTAADPNFKAILSVIK